MSDLRNEGSAPREPKWFETFLSRDTESNCLIFEELKRYEHIYARLSDILIRIEGAPVTAMDKSLNEDMPEPKSLTGHLDFLLTKRGDMRGDFAKLNDSMDGLLSQIENIL